MIDNETFISKQDALLKEALFNWLVQRGVVARRVYDNTYITTSGVELTNNSDLRDVIAVVQEAVF